MNFPSNIIEKFSLQDATLAAAYSQLAAHCVRFKFYMDRHDRRRKSYGSTRNTIYTFINSMFRISSEVLQPKPKRSLIGLIHEV